MNISLHLAFAADETLTTPEADHSPSALEAAEVDTARQEQARRYARQRQALSLAGMALSAVLVAVLLFTGLGFALRDALAGIQSWQPVTGWDVWRLAVYFLIVAAAGALISWPTGFYGGYVLSHRYGLSTQTLRAWLLDQLKGLVISLPIELLAVEFVYFLLAAAPSAWWLWTALALLLFTAGAANLAPVLLLPLFFKLTPLPEGDIRERALALAQIAGTRVRGIYSMNMSAKTTAANAFVIGLGNTRRVVLCDTLLDHYTPDEIEVIVAHELGHQAHRDIPKLIGVQVAVTLAGLFVVNLVLHGVVSHVSAYHGLADSATLPLIAAALGVFGLVTLPITNGYSRYVEHQADVYALNVTGKREAFISAMTRLANQNLAELQPAPLVEFFLYDHPATGRRITFAREYARISPAGE